MLGVDRFVATFGATPAGDTDAIVRVGVGAVRAGFAIVVDRPLTKIPMCVLNTRDAKRADEEAQQAAKEAGHPRWDKIRHDCGLKHAITDDKKARTILQRLTKDGSAVNIGVELSASRMVVVDVDTPEESAAFLHDWDAQGLPPISITVQSPGVQNEKGEWVHKDGGHYWFELPEDVELPKGTGAMKIDVPGIGGYSVMWADRQVLVPPSVRNEGPYRIVGQVNQLPGWLHDRIIVEVESRKVRAEQRINNLGDNDLDQWSARTSWDEILAPDGWELTGMPDGCSCMIWTAPGFHASPKSATAHDAGCSQYDTTAGHGPLHLWTDNPPEFLHNAGKTLTKLQYLGARDYGDTSRIGSVLRDLGISTTGNVEFPTFNTPSPDPIDYDEPPLPEVEAPAETRGLGTLGQLGASTSTDDGEDLDYDIGTYTAPEAEVSPELERVQLLMSKMKSSSQLEDLEDPEPLVTGLLDLDTFNRVVGKSNHGKSFVMLDLACHVAMDMDFHGHPVHQGMVVYMVAEGARGWKKRLRAWEATYNNGEFIPPDRLQVLDEPVQSANNDDWRAWRAVLKALGPVLVIHDTQARITVGVNENDNTEMGEFVERMEQIRRETGACVVVVHHLGHQGDQGRGASAVLGAISTELRVSKERTKNGDQLELEIAKQKDQDFAESLKFRLEDVEYETESGTKRSAVPVLIEKDDPLNDLGEVTASSPARDRMAALLFLNFNHGQGATKSELKTVCFKKHQFGVFSESNFYKVWSDMVAAKILVQQMNPNSGNLIEKYKLSDEEAVRLGLKSREDDA